MRQLAALSIVLALGYGCSNGDQMSGGGAADYKKVALDFTNALAARNYGAAYALTSKEYRDATTVEAMQAAFEMTVPTDWKTVGPVEVGQAMEDWPGKKPSDAGWVYVSVGGDVYSEAVTVVVTREGSELKIRTVEFGRP
jgi:hypothetical protein